MNSLLIDPFLDPPGVKHYPPEWKERSEADVPKESVDKRAHVPRRSVLHALINQLLGNIWHGHDLRQTISTPVKHCVGDGADWIAACEASQPRSVRVNNHGPN